jgi:hypothetical protein
VGVSESTVKTASYGQARTYYYYNEYFRLKEKFYKFYEDKYTQKFGKNITTLKKLSKKDLCAQLP